MEEAASLREIVVDVSSRVANFVFLAEGHNVLRPIGENSSVLENVHFPARNPEKADTHSAAEK